MPFASRLLIPIKLHGPNALDATQCATALGLFGHSPPRLGRCRAETRSLRGQQGGHYRRDGRLHQFVDYDGGVIFAELIPKDEWPEMVMIDARDASQYANGQIPGAINMDRRQVPEKRDDIPKNKPVTTYCNTGSLSAQAGFALRVAG